ncbi:MAG: hypothetical protein AAGA56_19150 [Myxococcota bacterium]
MNWLLRSGFDSGLGWALGVALVAGGCSSETEADGDTRETATVATTTPEGDGGGSSEGGEEEIEPGPEGVARISSVTARNFSSGAVERGSVSAQFYDIDPDPFDEDLETVGDCRVRTLTSLGGGGAPDYKDAGAIQITGGLTPIEVTRSTSFYDPIQRDTRLWDPGSSLAVVAEGGTDIGSFSATLVAPAHIEITQPEFFLGQDALTVDRGADLQLRWSGTTSGRIVVSIDRPNAPGEENESTRGMSCAFDPAAGQGTVPAAALGRLEAGSGTMTVDVVNAETLGVDGWGAVVVQLVTDGLNGQGVPYQRGITLQ